MKRKTNQPRSGGRPSDLKNKYVVPFMPYSNENTSIITLSSAKVCCSSPGQQKHTRQKTWVPCTWEWVRVNIWNVAVLRELNSPQKRQITKSTTSSGHHPALPLFPPSPFSLFLCICSRRACAASAPTTRRATKKKKNLPTARRSNTPPLQKPKKQRKISQERKKGEEKIWKKAERKE